MLQAKVQVVYGFYTTLFHLVARHQKIPINQSYGATDGLKTSLTALSPNPTHQEPSITPTLN